MKTYWVFMTIAVVAENVKAAKEEIARILKSGDGPPAWTIDDVVEVEEPG